MMLRLTDTRTKYLLLAIAVVVLGIGMLVLIIRQRPAAAVRQAFVKLGTAETFHIQTDLEITLPARLRGRERPFTKVTARVGGDVNRQSGTPELTGNLFVEARGRGNVFFADGDLRLLQDAVAFRLENLPVLLNPSGSLVRRWTYVDVPVLQTTNGEAVREAFASIINRLESAGTETIAGEELRRFTASFTPDEEAALTEVIRQRASGNRALHVLARLLQANNIRSFELWVAPGANELRRVRANFVRPLDDGSEFDFATLTLTFTDYGKTVTIDQPPRESSASPAVFGRLFGSGEVEALQQ